MLPAFLFYVSLVNDVRSLLAKHDFTAAAGAARSYQSQAGATPELAAALSWIARGELDAHQLDQADSYAAQSRKMTLDLLRTRKLDADPWLPTALGASIEVHAQVLAGRGQRQPALAFLREQLAAFGATSIGERISKNVNLIGLEGSVAPPIDGREWMGLQPPALSSLRGHPVLLFFWAHWCADCKGEIPILASVMQRFGPKGLVLIGPTRLYGYVAGGEEAPPAVEKAYIQKVRQQYYMPLSAMPVAVSNAALQTYGASTTPTLVLIDPAGIVRMYHPGAMLEAELSARIQKILGK